MVRFDDLQIFVQTVDAGSFSQAARVLNISPGLASSAVHRLEKALGTRLFVRSTRNMQLSDAGSLYLPHARQILSALEQGQQVLANTRSELAGTIRLSAPSDFGRNLLQFWLDEFQHINPAVTIHLKVSDKAVNLVSEPIDIAIRYGELADSRLVAWSLAGENPRTLCASPAYLQRHGTPASPHELYQHNCLRFIWNEQVHERWRFILPDGVHVIPVTGNRISDDADIVRRWAIAGEGLIYKSRLDLSNDILAGRLVEIFPTHYCEAAPLHMVYAHRELVTPLISQLQQYLRARCADLQAKLTAHLSE